MWFLKNICKNHDTLENYKKVKYLSFTYKIEKKNFLKKDGKNYNSVYTEYIID